MFRPEDVKTELENAKKKLGARNLAELSRKIDFPYGTMRQWEQAEQPLPNTRKWNEFLQKVHEAELKGGEQSGPLGKLTKEMQRRVMDRAANDAGFKARLMRDPKGAIMEELGESVPPGFGDIQIEVLEETPNKIYVVLPRQRPQPIDEDELTDEDLEDVAGGGGGPKPDTKKDCK